MAVTNLNLISKDQALVWQKQVEQKNAETKQLLADVGKALQDVQEQADSDIVDNIVKLGNDVCDAANSIYDAMQELHGIVDSVLSFFDKLIEKGVETLKSAGRKMSDTNLG